MNESEDRRVAVTGATGFVGRHLVDFLGSRPGIRVEAFCRRATSGASRPGLHVTGDLTSTDWTAHLGGVDTVFHLAAKAHDHGVSEEEIRKVNVTGTEAVASGALEAGVRKFVFLSSVKAQGGASDQGCFTEDGPDSPEDAYGRAKLDAERSLERIFARPSGSLAIVRSPLVYGPGVRANFLTLVRLVDRGYPLPLGAVRNRRSLVYVENLVDALWTVSADDRNGRYLVSDQEDLSTPELILAIAKGLDRRPRIVSVPPPVLRTLFLVSGRKGVARRLLSDLCVSTRRIEADHGWRAPFTVEEGMRRTMKWYRALTAPKQI